MNSTMRQSFRRAIGTAAVRWRNRKAIHGLLVVIAGLVLCSVAAIPIMEASRFAPATVGTVRVLVYLVLLALVLGFIVARVPSVRDRRRLVDHLESRASPQDEQYAPTRNTLLLTAVQMDAVGADAPLEQRLYERASAAVNDPGGITRDDRIGLRRATLGLAGLFCVIGVALFLIGDGARHGMKLLLVPWLDAQQGMPFRIVVEPGDTVVRERTDLVVKGNTVGFVPSDLTLLHRAVGEARWTRLPMRAKPSTDDASTADPQATRFDAQLLSVTQAFEYYVEGDNVRSTMHRVDVRYLPRVQRIDHVYRYPRYTGITQRVVESATDIAAVTGATVQIRVLPDRERVALSSAAGVRGELVLDDETRRPLTRDGEMLTASLSVDEASRYRIEMFAHDPRGAGEMVPVTPDHGIVALADGAPVVAVARPGSDARVTAVEEVQVQVQANDDVSLRQVELVYSINGEPEQVVALTATTAHDSPTSAASVTATHTLYLEERDLQAGDVISYHARASDGVVSRTAITDIQFMDVRPFDRDYRQGRSGRRGGGGGGGGGGNDDNLAAQQRDLVVALFRLARDGQRLDEEEQAKRLTTLSDAQKRVRGRVEAIVRRIKNRAVMQSAPGYAVMLDVMPKAITAMMRVEALLAVPDAEQSLPSAREALAHLQRADAAFREVQVASQQGGGGGGGGGRVGNNDLSRLFELEMDRFRNRYSQVQRAQAPQRQRQIDDTLDKLKELARRQREEVERARRRAQRPRGQNAGGGGTAASQQALAQALDELLRQLERLSREQSSGAMSAAQKAMQQAAQSMRQSAQAPQSAQAGSQSAASQSKPQAGGQGAGRGGAGAQQGPRKAGEESAQGGRTEATDNARNKAAADDPGLPAVQAARDALERLNAARQALAGDGNDQVSREVREARRRARSLVRRQEQVVERLQAGEDSAARSSAVAGNSGEQSAQAAQGGETPGDDRQRSIDELKAGMQVDAQQLREQLDRIASATQTAPQVRSPARRAGEVMREEDVEGRLRHSREQLAAGESYGTLESSIAQALRRVQEQVEQAGAAADAQLAQDRAQNESQSASASPPAGGQSGGPSGGQRGAGAGNAADGLPNVEQLREMMRGLAGLRDRMSSGGGGGTRGTRAAGPGGRSRDDLRGLANDLNRLGGLAGAGSLGPVASNYDPAGDLRTLLEGIESLATQTALGGTQVSDALLAALARVERFLKGSAEAGLTVVPTGRDARTPPQYRTLVEAYYRRLSEVDEGTRSRR